MYTKLKYALGEMSLPQNNHKTERDYNAASKGLGFLWAFHLKWNLKLFTLDPQFKIYG